MQAYLQNIAKSLEKDPVVVLIENVNKLSDNLSFERQTPIPLLSSVGSI